MKFGIPARLCLQLTGIAFISFSNSALSADTPFTELLQEDAQEVVTAPLRWHTNEWENAAWASLAVVTSAALLDAPLRDAMRRQPGDNTFLLVIERFGAEYSLGVVGGFYLAGNVSGNDKTRTVAQDALAASIIASGLITPAIKIASGRSRPYENTGTNNFQGFGSSNRNSSFPSGHTTEAFALASVIAAHYEEAWIKNSAYAVAGLVGISRTYHDAHFASDVLAGAMIGYWVGQSVVSHNRQKRTQNIMLIPESTQDIIGLRLTGIY